MLATSLVAVTGHALFAQPAQQRVTIPDAISCNACRISLGRPDTLQQSEAGAPLVSPYHFVADSRGRIAFTDPFGDVRVRVHGSGGRQLAQLGRRGNGPGEFTQVFSLLYGRGDSLWVLGSGLHVFSPALAFSRSSSLPGGMVARNAIRLANGNAILSGMINSRESYGEPFHLFDGQDIVRSFGLRRGESSVSAWAQQRIMAAVGPADFLAARPNSYRIERWTESGTLRVEYIRQASWFADWSEWDGRPDLNPPPPRVLAMSVLNDTLLVALIAVADANWRQTSREGRESAVPDAEQLSNLYDSVIEVVDLHRGIVVAQRRFPQLFVALLDRGLAIENFSMRSGETAVRAWPLALEGAHSAAR